jgi:hypothetical protein
MSKGCDHVYFTRPAGWRVTESTSPDEEVGHVVLIYGPSDDLTIACQAPKGVHPPYKGKHNQTLGRIEPSEGLHWTIICIPGNKPEEDQIKYESDLPTGSWTAEDNGGGAGGGEG